MSEGLRTNGLGHALSTEYSVLSTQYPSAAAKQEPVTSASLLVRPRTAGEILDDAFRLYFAQGPLLLALTALTAIPALGGLLWLLTQPTDPDGVTRWLVPALLATWLPLLGLSSGACQEVLQCQAEHRGVGLRGALTAAVRRGLGHLATCASVQMLAMPGLWLVGRSLLALLTEPFSAIPFFFGLLGLAWLGAVRWLTMAAHPLLAARPVSWWQALRDSVHESQQQAGRALPVVVAEFALLLFAILNGYIVTHVGLWIAEHLAGFDVAFAGTVLAASNPVYVLALVLLAGLLLAPYGEATGYLLHMDARARSEGLDLRYRVLRCFPPSDGKRAVLVLLTLGGVLFGTRAAWAEGLQRATVQQAHAEVQAIRTEVAAATPYPGGQRWQARLQTVAEQLEREAGPGTERMRWLRDALVGFALRKQEGALQVLEDLDRRLALLEESLTPPENATGRLLSREEIRKLLPAPTAAEPEKTAKQKEKPPKPEPVRRDTEVEFTESRGRRGSAVVPSAPSGGFGLSGWLILGAIVLVAALVAFLKSRPSGNPTPPPKPQTGTTAPTLETILTQPDRYTADGLWKAANDLASAGRFREAVHTLYLSVLVLLHRGRLIRYERTRTNGEYVFQLRGRDALHGPFAELTYRFEVQWYGDQTSQAADYAACLALAQRLTENVPA